MTTGSSSITLLCVDDEPGFVDLTATFFEQSDDRFTTTTATSATVGLEQLGTTAVDCFGSDYEMSDIDGLEFLEAVREEHPDLPFLLFTGEGSEEIASDAISAGVTDYMQKKAGTDHHEVLAQRVRNAVERWRAHERYVETENRARTTLEATPDAVLVSIDEEYVYTNSAAVNLFDATEKADLLGRSPIELTHPDDRGCENSNIDRKAPNESVFSRVRNYMTVVAYRGEFAREMRGPRMHSDTSFGTGVSTRHRRDGY